MSSNELTIIKSLKFFSLPPRPPPQRSPSYTLWAQPPSEIKDSWYCKLHFVESFHRCEEHASTLMEFLTYPHTSAAPRAQNPLSRTGGKSLKNNNDTLNHKIPMTRRNILFSFTELYAFCVKWAMVRKGRQETEWSTSRYSSPQKNVPDAMFISFHDLNRKSTAFLLFHPRLLFREAKTSARRDEKVEEKLSNFHFVLINSRGMSIKNMCFQHFSSRSEGAPCMAFQFPSWFVHFRS